MHETVEALFLTGPDRLLERVKAEVGSKEPDSLPADDHAGEAVDH
jgi:hypothetical protein